MIRPSHVLKLPLPVIADEADAGLPTEEGRLKPRQVRLVYYSRDVAATSPAGATTWVGNGSKVHGVQIALNIADVQRAARRQPVRRMATRRTRHHLLLWPASLRWTRRLVIWRAASGREFCAYSRTG
jgi:hypothetical protein